MKRIWVVFIGFVIGVFIVPRPSFAITPQQLHGMLDQDGEVTIVDIRNRALYTEGHIPGAISIPASLIAKKRLPPVGTVIVCGDGIRTDLSLEAVNALNTRAGIQAEMLEGGFSAWEALNLTTTHKSGLGRKNIRYLSYQELEKAAANNPDMVLVDLRSLPVQGDSSTGRPGSKAAQVQNVANSNLTDLSEKFPELNTIRLTRMRSSGRNGHVSIAALGGNGTHHRRLYVLIDEGNGEAEKVAHRLKAAGIKRVVILAGGELILSRDGQSGLKTIDSKE